mmetsp:Transcript_2017/g.4105  ORF Transcript_2017/g.4105 Transcript_2017/m.4105 type:complete len:129 (-) Transcript_2017:439-825(-)
MLADARRSGYVMCASTPGAAHNPRQVGLSGGHVYSLLDARVNIAGTGIHLVKLRDPGSWGLSSGFSGDWSMQSAKWRDYPQVAAAVLVDGEAPSNDDEVWASFWMSYDDFCKYFGSVDIAAHNPEEMG